MMRKALAVSEKPDKSRPMVRKSAPRPSELRSSSAKPVSAVVLSDSRFNSAVRLCARNSSARCSASLRSSICRHMSFRSPGLSVTLVLRYALNIDQLLRFKAGQQMPVLDTSTAQRNAPCERKTRRSGE